MKQRNSLWADEEVEAANVSKQMRSVASKRRTRQRGARRGSDAPPLPKRQVTIKENDMSADVTISESWTPVEMATEESPTIVMIKPPFPTFTIQELLLNSERCNEVITKLEDGDQVERHEMLMLLLKGTRQLALSKAGCRVVQKELEVADNQDRELIIKELKDYVAELYESPHGNHVLARAIETLPVAKCDFVISALLGRGVGVCKHRFGCRVICRLIEHCTEDQIGHLLDEILVEGQAVMLARHAYGNFPVQAALEHGSEARKWAVLQQFLPCLGSLAMHRTGSLVVQRLLEYCCSEGQNLAIRALRQAEGESSLLEIACSHYGSFVIEQLAGLQQSQSEALAIAASLASNKEHLETSPHGQRVAIAFRLASTEQLGGVN